VKRREPRPLTVYALCDPRLPGDGGVRYIGATVNLKQRFSAHLWIARHTPETLGDALVEGCASVYSWIRDLGREKLTPTLRVLLENATYADETRLIRDYRAKGVPLTNVQPREERGVLNPRRQLWQIMQERARIITAYRKGFITETEAESRLLHLRSGGRHAPPPAPRGSRPTPWSRSGAATRPAGCRWPTSGESWASASRRYTRSSPASCGRTSFDVARGRLERVKQKRGPQQRPQPPSRIALGEPIHQ
jgi:hypothetical protein